LGQKPPGMTPEIFAPRIISTGHGERIAAFSPNGKEFYYALWGAPHGVILQMNEIDGQWTKPKVASFSGRFEGDFTMSPDGKMIVFSSNRPFDRTSKPINHHYAWFVKRTQNGWGEPKPFGPEINDREFFAGCPTIAASGNLYFFSDKVDGIGKEDIWMSQFIDEKYLEAENLGSDVNTEQYDLDPFIAPDESYLIVTYINRTVGNNANLHISFKKKDGSWTKAISMGDEVNSPEWEYCPTVSPDGKYLFFTSTRRAHKPYSETPITYEEKIKILNSPGNGMGDIYWVDAKIIEELKPAELK